VSDRRRHGVAAPRPAVPPPGIDVSDAVTVVPANQASWEDLQAVLGVRGYAAYCQCQRYKIGHHEWTDVPLVIRMERLRQETHCGDPDAPTTSGLVAYLDGEPAGWCAVEPRSAYPRLRNSRGRVTWSGRNEDPDDDTVWTVTCFVTRAGYRRRGISRALARAAVPFARERGARALEGYPMVVEPGQNVTWGELNVGSRSIFADAGFREVSRPTLRRAVMRIDFQPVRSPRRAAAPGSVPRPTTPR
jgi:GNAT superfamily N-acetyltransferase